MLDIDAHDIYAMPLKACTPKDLREAETFRVELEVAVPVCKRSFGRALLLHAVRKDLARAISRQHKVEVRIWLNADASPT